MDIYVVTYGTNVVGASAKFQGAEQIKADAARRYAAYPDGTLTDEDYQGCYDRMRIVNTELQDGE